MVYAPFVGRVLMFIFTEVCLKNPWVFMNHLVFVCFLGWGGHETCPSQFVGVEFGVWKIMINSELRAAYRRDFGGNTLSTTMKSEHLSWFTMKMSRLFVFVSSRF